jgi:hypothetical protein
VGAASLQRFRVRVHTITDYKVEANVVVGEELREDLIGVHKAGGMDGLVAKLRTMLSEKEGVANVVGSHGIEVEFLP